MAKIHPLQEKIIDIFEANGGSLPSFRAIAKEIGVSSTNTVSYHVNKLKEQGYLEAGGQSRGKVRLTLKSLLELDKKSGVFILLKNTRPLFIGESENLKDAIFNTALKSDSSFYSEIENDPEKIFIAYQLVDTETERKSLEEQLLDFYRSKGFKI